MAAARKRRRRRPGARSSPSEAEGSSPARRLRRLDETLAEWRYEPKASRGAIAAVVALSLGGVSLGMGVYAQWLRDEALEPLSYGPYLLVAGVALLIGYMVLSRDLPGVLRVGDLGVGVEGTGAKITRTPWYELSSISLADDTLRVESDSLALALPLREQGAAVRRIVAEASERIPKRVDVHEEDLERIGEPRSAEGEPQSVEPPQVTGQSCMSSDQPLTFEKDVRMCARCGALYHKTGVPKRCAGCGVKLRR